MTAASPAADMNPKGGPAVRRATLVGASAIVMWATLALLTGLAGPVPPFLLVALSLGVGALVSLGVILATRRPLMGALRQPAPVWLLGIGGLFGYHFLYFLALQTAPAAEANLINYLWPLLIVLFAGLLPGERLGKAQVLGALAGLAGTLLLITGGAGLRVRLDYLPGYLSAVACAVTWATYSVLSRRFGTVPTETVVFFCLATALLAVPCHLLFEQTVWPSGWGWAAVVAMGLGPVGLAFFVWDHGVKRGDIQALGALSYATPLLSTGLLILAGRAALSWPVVGACVLIVGGAIIAGRRLAR